MKFLPLLLAVAIDLAGQPVPAQETITIRDENMPGRLETFLIATPKATLNKKVLAILESSGKATFTAIVAADPDTKVKEGGVEVQFEEGNLKTVAYLNEGCLKRLEKSLGCRPALFPDETERRERARIPLDKAPQKAL